MYWIYFVIFIIAVLVPDIVAHNYSFLTETRAEELAIFVLGAVGFAIFIFKEYQISVQHKEREKNQQKLIQTAKDLIDSYSYIGEVNRKIEILMNIVMSSSDQSSLNKDKAKEIYNSIIEAANSIMKGEYAFLRFVNVSSGKTLREMKSSEKNDSNFLKNQELIEMNENETIKKSNGHIIICSQKIIKGAKCCLVISGYDHQQELNVHNSEILKFFASQALFLFSYV